VGLSTRGGGGNTVRNITACAACGVCPDELFDVAPYAVALSAFLLPDPLSYQLPRKYKIALSGCSQDCAGASVNDLGLIARQSHGGPGFAVYVAGGLGAESRVGVVLEEFVPADEIHHVAEAVKRVFDQHGNRRDRHKARLRFLLEQVGLEQFRQWYAVELEHVRSAAPAKLVARPLPGGAPLPTASHVAPGPGFDAWRQQCVEPQKQAGYFVAHVPLTLGEIAADTLEQFASVVERFGDGCVRTTQQQGFAIRWVPANALPALHAALASLGLAAPEPPVLRNVVACTGASTCRLGICLSRGLAAAVRAALVEAELDLTEFGDLQTHISGCPNSCSRHAIADIGLFGVARRVEGRLAPHYTLLLGGSTAKGHTRLATGNAVLPARSVPRWLVDYLRAFRRSAEFPDFTAFVDGVGRSLAEALAERHREATDFQQDASNYVDWSAAEPFSLAGRGPGECGAGVFDLIEVDLQSARDALAADNLWEATVLAARALLVTRGHLAQDAGAALELFERLFLADGLVDAAHAELLASARQASCTPAPQIAFRPAAASVQRFVEAIQKLYAGMDSSLRFQPVREAAATATEAALSATPARAVDLRGVVCPLNYVRTKMALDRLARGDVLALLIDREGAQNVPPSVANDGHEVLEVRPDGDDWRLLIRKGG
jgi:sulfite reductase (ferredoxin)